MNAVALCLQVLCYLTVIYAWRCSIPPQHTRAVQIDAGMGSVVMRDRRFNAYFLSGSSWMKLGTAKLRHVSVGPAGIWGVGRFGRVHKFVAGNFVAAKGRRLRQVDAGGYGQVVGVRGHRRSFCLRSPAAITYNHRRRLYWNRQGKRLQYYSCGLKHGCWGTDRANRIFVTARITASTCRHSGWMQVEGRARMVEVGTDGSVFVVNRQGSVFQRVGISSRNPRGIAWRPIPMHTRIRHVSYDLGRLWVVTKGGVIMKCT